jgi:HD-GYP domain-containing protein (c-di-GMP phosphodiesterase class II)
MGAHALEELALPWDIVPLVRHHHERFDGKGYPDGLEGEAIPFGAMVIGLADYYDNLVAFHHGHRGKTPQQAQEMLLMEEDRGFAAALLHAFAEVMPALEELIDIRL